MYGNQWIHLLKCKSNHISDGEDVYVAHKRKPTNSTSGMASVHYVKFIAIFFSDQTIMSSIVYLHEFNKTSFASNTCIFQQNYAISLLTIFLGKSVNLADKGTVTSLISQGQHEIWAGQSDGKIFVLDKTVQFLRTFTSGTCMTLF